MNPQVLFLGGNGHTPARLGPARATLTTTPAAERFPLHDVPLPGFAGREPAASWDDFLDQVEREVGRLGGERPGSHVYATGIGGLVALCLRGRGRLLETPLILQGAVLWGLETRTFPRLMRLVPRGPALLQRLFGLAPVQRRFVRQHFMRPPAAELQQAFFQGYRECASFPDFFDWMTPALLRELEATFRAAPEALERLRFWWGDRDSVVGPEEVEWTEAALGRRFQRRVLAGWGHYPMIDDPAGWVGELSRELAGAPTS